MSTQHHFSVKHAQQYGLREAVLIQNLHFWVAHNYANGKHKHDGRTWTYNSVHAFEALFPYLSYKQIRTSLEALITLDVLVRGYYSTNPADRSSWFAFTDEFLAENPLPERAVPATKKTPPSAPQGKCPSALQGTPSAQEGKSLIEQIVNTDSKQGEGSADAPHLAIPADLLSDFLAVRKAKKSGPLTKTALAGIARESAKAGLSLIEGVTYCCEVSWPSFNPVWYAERTAGKPARTAALQAESFAERDARNARERWEQMTGRTWPADELPGAAKAAPMFLDAEITEIKRLSK